MFRPMYYLDLCFDTYSPFFFFVKQSTLDTCVEIKKTLSKIFNDINKTTLSGAGRIRKWSLVEGKVPSAELKKSIFECWKF